MKVHSQSSLFCFTKIVRCQQASNCLQYPATSGCQRCSGKQQSHVVIGHTSSASRSCSSASRPAGSGSAPGWPLSNSCCPLFDPGLPRYPTPGTAAALAWVFAVAALASAVPSVALTIALRLQWGMDTGGAAAAAAAEHGSPPRAGGGRAAGGSAAAACGAAGPVQRRPQWQLPSCCGAGGAAAGTGAWLGAMAGCCCMACCCVRCCA